MLIKVVGMGILLGFGCPCKSTKNLLSLPVKNSFLPFLEGKGSTKNLVSQPAKNRFVLLQETKISLVITELMLVGELVKMISALRYRLVMLFRGSLLVLTKN